MPRSAAAQLTRQLLAFGRRQVMRSTCLDLNVAISSVVVWCVDS